MLKDDLFRRVTVPFLSGVTLVWLLERLDGTFIVQMIELSGTSFWVLGTTVCLAVGELLDIFTEDGE